MLLHIANNAFNLAKAVKIASFSTFKLHLFLKAGSSDNLRPVMFLIHGGGYTGGTGAYPLSNGSNLASRKNIVVVSINYRLSTLEFFAIPDSDISGNYGIGDQITAFEWVIQNIAYFDGGESCWSR